MAPPHKTALTAAALGLALALSSSLACAQASRAPAPDAPASQPMTVAMAAAQQVEVTGHYDNGVGTSDAASQGTVRGERLADLPLLRPGEVLETVPGLVVTQHSGDGKANQYFLRGYNLDHGTDFATWVDGVPVNMPTNAHGQGYTDLNFLIPELVDTHRLPQGPVLRRGRRLRVGRLRAHPATATRSTAACCDLAGGGDGYGRLLLAGSPVAVVRRTAPRGPRLLGALEVQRDDGPWTTPEGMRKFNGVLR